MTDEPRRIEINWVQSTAGALTAVTSAVLLSTVGVAGTLIGAALGSILATVGNAVYAYYIRGAKERVLAAQTVAVARIGLAQNRLHDASDAEDLAEAEVDLERAREVLEEADPDPAPDGVRGALAGLPWKRIALVASAIFAVAMLVILAFELLTGRAVSSYTGGSDSDRRTSISWGDPGDGRGDQAPQDAPIEDEDGSDEEDLLVPETDPAEEPTGEPTTEPTSEPTGPTGTPTGEPAPEMTPTAPVPSAPPPTADSP